MLKIFKNIVFPALLFATFAVSAQTTTSSPYSQYGLGNIKGSLLPQNRAMGGISAGVSRIGLYNNINMANPASYASISMTTIDIGAYGGLTQLSNGSLSQNNFNASLNHVAFAMPVTKKSAISFGLLPYSDRGYQYRVADKIDSNVVNYLYSGDGGISKAYLGYGIGIGKHLSIGFNAAVLFGKIKDDRSTEFPDNIATFMNSQIEESSSISGLTFDYGAQYKAKISPKTDLTLGYAGSVGNKIKASATTVVTRYFLTSNSDDAPSAIDSTYYKESARQKLTLPMSHTIGFTLNHSNKWLLGADYNMTNWSDYKVGNTAQGLNDSYSIAVGGQYTPDITSVTNYFKLIDYRLGFKYDKTYININNTDITQKAITFGLGLPLPSSRTSFYKINLGAEFGQRGSYTNNLVRERYINFYLGFTLNDQWFQKYKFD